MTPKFLAIDYVWPHCPEECDLRFFLGHPDVEWVELGSTDAAGERRAGARARLGSVVRDLEAGRYAAVLLGHPPPLGSPRKPGWRNAARAVKHFARDPAAWRKYALLRTVLRRFADRVPMVALDLSDRMVIDNARFPILEASTWFFKRELPQNPCNAFLYTTDKTECAGNVQHVDFFARQVPKLRPCSLGLADAFVERLAAVRVPKETDLFFAGATKNRPTRQAGLRLLKQLAAEGYRIDLPEQYLSREEFFQRAARARLAWSPEGFGYDCHRTYEVAALGCVPVLQYPPVFRHEGFVDGRDSLHYAVDDDSLLHVVRRALADRAVLEAMGQRARERVLRHHRHSRLAEMILREATAGVRTAAGSPAATSGASSPDRPAAAPAPAAAAPTGCPTGS